MPYVSSPAVSVTPAAPPTYTFSEPGFKVNPAAPWNLVHTKFEESMRTAEEMLDRLVGANGTSGYLGALNSVIKDFGAPVIGVIPVNVPVISVAPTLRPVPTLSNLDTNFPALTAQPPSALAIPNVDLSNITPVAPVALVDPTINWLAIEANTALFNVVLAKITEGLVTGSTGLDPVIENQIWARALDRQAIETDKKYVEVEDYFASRGFSLPSGAMAGRLQETANEAFRNLTDVNSKIAIEQAELAQKNAQFMLTIAKDFETLIRDTVNKQNDRSLDYAKTVAANTINIYTEKIKAYIASMEANKIYVEVQIENLKAVVEYNKGLYSQFALEVEAYGKLTDAKSKRNEAFIEVFKAEVVGYEAEVKAIVSTQDMAMESAKLNIMNAEMTLRASIANATNALGSYTAESSLREKVATAMANIAMQSVASAYGAVNASAGLSYSGQASQSENWSHAESRQQSWSNSKTESASVSVSGQLAESHNYADQ